MEHTRYARSFQRARFQAELEQIWARLTGRSIDLLDFEDVRQRLHMELTARRVLREIPIDAIVGSVGRPGDFTRDFRPLNDRDENRWAQIKYRANQPKGLPPIEVYQVGEAYFVLDGNHRVSVARDMGTTHIEAYVTEVRSPIALTPDVDPRALILKARHLEFLERTHLDALRPGADLQLTRLGHYAELDRHISLHRFVLGMEQRREVTEAEAVVDWYDHIYLPVVHVIHTHGALAKFPGRTEADLYLAVSGYRPLLEEYLDWEFEGGAPAAEDTPEPQSGLFSFLGRVLGRLPDHEPAEVLPGEWRREQINSNRASLGADFKLFTNLLVPVTGTPSGWAALTLAGEVARREHGRVLGLYVVPESDQHSDAHAKAVRAEFDERCREAGVAGQMAIEYGDVANRICERSAWVDMTVVRLSHPPRPQPWAKLSSGFHNLIRHCASPLLVTPRPTLPRLGRAVVAYNGSPKADRALQIASYLARQWNIALAVVCVGAGGSDSPAILARARAEVEAHGLTATYHAETGPVAEIVLKQANDLGTDLIVMGGYGRGPFLEIALGSTVDHVLRRSLIPMLICP